jgi:hypothetical protein
LEEIVESNSISIIATSKKEEKERDVAGNDVRHSKRRKERRGAEQ